MYLPVFRNALPEMFEVFDFADPSMVTGKRNASTVAPQALFLMNHPFVLEQAKHAAARLLAESHADDAARVTRAYRLALGRAPTDGEREVAKRFLAREARAEGRVGGAVPRAVRVGRFPVRELKLSGSRAARRQLAGATQLKIASRVEWLTLTGGLTPRRSPRT